MRIFGFLFIFLTKTIPDKFTPSYLSDTYPVIAMSWRGSGRRPKSIQSSIREAYHGEVN